ncbi:hypothetical protein F66182_8899 [Fusarium sp. NRRL 66182]|nr:hypothetical protein F66182_8899 [Fusarium sp. NRRL 66182]
MADQNPVDEPEFIVSGGKRPGVEQYDVNYKYAPGDKVFLLSSGQKLGPYKVESTNGGKYVLCDNSGITARGGQAYQEHELTLYDPFA